MVDEHGSVAEWGVKLSITDREQTCKFKVICVMQVSEGDISGMQQD